ncbi:LysR family transcriptional regulator [Vibrio salinus]|uniref:LysR family transcriptional regulator n=1 Tax=Vibrio salinus TaxID=2899784 RepID=UPI001E426862|nr:LysR family transcriptional regulator [Vibrio salinus]MCE0496107.1 LysR family transcriptional regulator [Vibrio salinus]
MIDSMKVFCMVVKKNGFRAAASELDISPAMVSRHINKLEYQLKTSLLKRNTRSITLTVSGQMFFDHCGNILSLYDQCLNQISGENNTLSGNLKVGVPHSISQLHVIPALEQFYRSHPNLTLDIIAGNHSLELFSHGYDLALHCGPLPDSTLYYTLIGYWGKHTVASQAYLDQHGTPQHPDDLHKHNCLLHFDNQSKAWRYTIDRKEVDMPVFGQTRINNSLDLYQMALNGLGIAYLPDFTVGQAIEDRKLVNVLTEYMPPPLPMFVVHINPRPSKREQVFIDFIKQLSLAKCPVPGSK